MKLEIKYDRKADAVYLRFSDQEVAYSKRLDTERTVDYSEEGEIRGIEFLFASSGMKTDDLPYRSAIERALQDRGIVKLMHKYAAGRLARGYGKDAKDSGEALSKAEMRVKITVVMWTGVATLAFIGLAAADILLTRNLFVLTSMTGIVASLLGLVVVMFPTVAGCLILLAWVFYTYREASRL